jgi:integrase
MLGTLPSDAGDTKNKKSKLRYWSEGEFANWSLAALRPADLIQWRREVLDEDGDGKDAECSPQTVIHRLNTLSQLFKWWALAHDHSVSNPVIEGVRPGTPRGRDRRLYDGEEWRLLNAARNSSRPWLRPAIVIALETAMRQTELAELTWDRVKLDTEHPHCDLPRTKNERPRRVSLSRRAVAAFRVLWPETEDGKREKSPKGHVLPVITGRGVAHGFADITPEQTFPDLRWHDLRHEAVSRLFERTDLRDNEIMAISGHLRPEMLTRYTHLRSDTLAARLPGGKLHMRRRKERSTGHNTAAAG